MQMSVICSKCKNYSSKQFVILFLRLKLLLETMAPFNHLHPDDLMEECVVQLEVLPMISQVNTETI